MSRSTRRQVLREIAVAALSAPIPLQSAQHVHRAAAEVKKKTSGVYKPRLFTPLEWAALRRLADLIVPADEVSKGALEAGAPEFIDLLCSNNEELAAIYTGGLAWLDRQIENRHGTVFAEAKAEHQTAILDLIAYRKNMSPDLGPGIRFFEWARRMVVDAFYTSPIGIKDVGYTGNKGQTTFHVPAAAIDYALKRSGLG